MKKAFILPILALLLITACEKEKTTTATSNADLPVTVETKQDTKSVPTPTPGLPATDRSSNKVLVCHQVGNGEYNLIEVSENAVADHLTHGDYLPDADGDGYTPAGTCGGQDDCDDTNAAIHPGAEEVCGDNIDNNCDGHVDESCLLPVTLPDGSIMYVHPNDNGIIEWGGYGTTTGATDQSNGELNTAAIVTRLVDNGGTAYAAKVCDDLIAYGYDDWYMPSKQEMQEMYRKLGPTNNGYNGSGDMTFGYYWSSTEVNAQLAWRRAFNFDYEGQDSKYAAARCRCVRK